MPSPPASPSLHPRIEAAARGVLPPWAEVSAARRKHMERVAALLARWAEARGESPHERARWVAAGYLHDALREADPKALRPIVPPPFRELPGKVLHGPGAAARLREEGVADEELLHAVAYHTLGSEEFQHLGWALFAADFLEPGRTLREKWRAKLRGRASGDLEGVVREILQTRIQYLAERGRPIHPRTVAFWNRMVEGKEWASASEV